MKWVMKEPSFGDMIRVELGGIYHVGIYVSDDEVIQFGLAPSQRVTLRDSEVEVLSSDIDRFLVGGFLEVCEFDKKEKKKNRKPADVVKFARSRLGMRGYNIIYNTVPSVIFGRDFLSKVDRDTLLIELASVPGGFDICAARELGANISWALSLPGKYAPESAGAIIAENVLKILGEVVL